MGTVTDLRDPVTGKWLHSDGKYDDMKAKVDGAAEEAKEDAAVHFDADEGLHNAHDKPKGKGKVKDRERQKPKPRD